MDQKQPIRGRFAPSPSGRMHLGNLFAALLAWLDVRSLGGEMVLRMEDLDPQRCKPAYLPQLAQDLLWLGLDWDTGWQPGDTAYTQSHRTAVYQTAFHRLEEQGLVYPVRGRFDHVEQVSLVYECPFSEIDSAQKSAYARLYRDVRFSVGLAYEVHPYRNIARRRFGYRQFERRRLRLSLSFAAQQQGSG